MINVYYVYEKVERTREKVGFSCKRYEVREFIGEYPDVEAAKKHSSTLTEKEYPGGAYLITPNKVEELKELPPRVTKPIDKKTKKK